MEAMAASLPVVAADAMALPHLVRPGYSGFLYPPGRSDLLAATLACLADDPDRRVAMGRAGHDIIAAHGLGRTLDTFEDLYRRFVPVKAIQLADRQAVPAGSRGL
jgi:glycosyltransferase involved in cell wall biosynthesis